MILLLLILSLFGILSLEYFSLKRDLSNPAFLFTLGFFTASLILSCFVKKWSVDLHWTSFSVIILGNLGVYLGACACSKFFRTNKRIYITDTNNSPTKLVSLNGLIFLFALQIAMYLLRIYLLKQFYGGSLPSALAAHTMAIKFGTEKALQMPFGSSFFYGMAGTIGYVCAFLLPFYMMYKNISFRIKFWLWANFILCMIGSLLSSGRTAMICLLISFASFYIISLNLRKIKIKINVILKWLTVAFLFLFSFQQLGYVIGREESESNWFDEIGIYCGAEIQNLDDFIEEPKFQNYDNLYGQLTFNLFYNKFGYLIGVNQLITEGRDYHRFNYRNEYSLGNVDTALQHYWYDFGITGTFILCLFIGIFMQALYKLITRSRNIWIKGYITPYLFVYSIMIPTTFMSFFSEAFFEKIVQLFDFRFWTTYILIYIPLYKKNLAKKTSFISSSKRFM